MNLKHAKIGLRVWTTVAMGGEHDWLAAKRGTIVGIRATRYPLLIDIDDFKSQSAPLGPLPHRTNPIPVEAHEVEVGPPPWVMVEPCPRCVIRRESKDDITAVILEIDGREVSRVLVDTFAILAARISLLDEAERDLREKQRDALGLCDRCACTGRVEVTR